MARPKKAAVAAPKTRKGRGPDKAKRTRRTKAQLGKVTIKAGGMHVTVKKATSASTGAKRGRKPKVASGGGFGMMHESANSAHKKSTSKMLKAKSTGLKKVSKAGRPRKAMGKDGANHNQAKTVAYMNAGAPKKRGRKNAHIKHSEAVLKHFAPKKRGPKAKAKTESTTPKRGRGRPKKTTTAPVAEKKKRGRPAKAKTAKVSTGKKRGRPAGSKNRTIWGSNLPASRGPTSTPMKKAGVSKGAKMTSTSIRANVHKDTSVKKVGTVKATKPKATKVKRSKLRAA